jgi:hypothetical protein
MAKRNDYRTNAKKLFELEAQLEDCIIARTTAKGKMRANLTKRIQKLRPMVEKARKATDAAYSSMVQAA